jgi:sulfoxide reductase heme-binding subunit YedZ
MLRSQSMRLAGWPIVGWCTLVLVSLMLLVLAWNGTAEPGVRAVVRASARTSFVLFVSTFVASALFRTWSNSATRWMLANRRYLGVSFAVSHFIHLLSLLALARVSTQFVATLNATTLVGGGLAYVFITAMVVTSFDRTAAWMSPRAWRRLHATGMYYIWGIFFLSYLPRAVVHPAYAPFAVVLFAAIGLRIYAAAAQRQSLALAA